MRVRQVYRDVFARVPGGIERHVVDLATGLSTLADVMADVEVVGAARRPWPWRRRVDRLTVRAAAEFGRVGGVPLAPGVPLAVAWPRADVVHHHGPNPAGELALPLQRRPTVATWHCDPHRMRRAHSSYAAAAAAALSSCGRVIVSSQRLAERSEVVRRLADRRPDAIEVVPFGVDIDRFRPGDGATGTIRGNGGLGGVGAGTDGDRAPRPACSPVVLFVGRLRAYKGLDVLLRAASTLDATMVVAGDGPERDRLAAVGAEMLGDRLRMLGAVPDPDLPALYRSADVVCLPSTTAAEAFGLVLLEAMACGVPVISTEVGTATSVINRHGETGFVVPPADPEALRAALEQLLADPARAAVMGRNARDHVRRNHDVADMARAVHAVYREVVDAGGTLEG